jgi:hypothetical protein
MMRLNLKMTLIILLASIVPVVLSHFAVVFSFDDFIRMMCFIFSIFVLPGILFWAYQKLKRKKKTGKQYYFIMVLQSLLTVLLLDSEGTTLLEELNGGEGQPIAIAMLIIPLIVFTIHFGCQKLLRPERQ